MPLSEPSLEIACTYCTAAVGQRCMTITTEPKPRSPHQDRLDAYAHFKPWYEIVSPGRIQQRPMEHVRRRMNIEFREIDYIVEVLARAAEGLNTPILEIVGEDSFTGVGEGLWVVGWRELEWRRERDG